MQPPGLVSLMFHWVIISTFYKNVCVGLWQWTRFLVVDERALWLFLLFFGCSTAAGLLEPGLLRLRCEVAPAVTKVLLGSLKGRERGRRRFRVAIRAGVWALVPTDVSEPKWQFVSGFESDVATYAGISLTKAGSCAVYLAVYYTQRPRDSMAAIPESAVTDNLAVSNSHLKKWKQLYIQRTE